MSLHLVVALLTSPQLAPMLPRGARVVRTFESLLFLGNKYERTIPENPEYVERHFAAVGASVRGAVVSEDGRFAFRENLRSNLRSASPRPVEYWPNVAYRRAPGADPAKAKGTPTGIVSSLLSGDRYPPLNRFARAGVGRPLWSGDGSTVFAQIRPTMRYGFHVVGTVPLASERPGTIAAVLDHTLSTHALPGSSPELAMLQELTGDGGPRLYLVERGRRRRVRGPARLSLWFQPAARAALATEAAAGTVRMVRTRYDARDRGTETVGAPIPERWRSLGGGEGRLLLPHIALMADGRRATMSRSWAAPEGLPRSHTLMYDFGTGRWSLLAEGLVVRGSSASGRLLLMGPDDVRKPGWLVRLD